ncbi:Short-chain dehydrogenase/reductase SDR? [hydrothermal vent metagenome]|uniref:Short-chain dehydrogenase/reductase SDR n=1 Tax=hydrothermal vent metagenome TaxID=652676 RepID=A0A3B1CWW5_9ZZZZ
MKKAIIVGATSGIGCELAKVLFADGYAIGITGRRLHLLEKLKNELPNRSFIKLMDVSNENARNDLKNLIDEMQGVDLIVISAGIGSIDPKLPWKKEKETIETNVLGFTAMANVAYHYFQQKGSGHLLGISSIAAIRGGDSPAYNASKSFVSNYLQGLQYIVAKGKSTIVVTDVQPGFVDTDMAQGEGLFWVASPQKAAAQIYRAIKNKKRHVYITKRWRVIGWLLKMMPDAVYNRL